MSDAPDQLTPFDFRRPGRLPDRLEDRLDVWLTNTCSLLPDKWAEHLGFAVTVAPREAGIAAPATAQLPPSPVAFRVWMEPWTEPTLLTFPRQCLLALLDGILGGDAQELPADRELTALEQSLAEMLVLDLCDALNESQAGGASVHCQVGEFDGNPKLVRVYAAQRALVLLPLEIQGPFGSQVCQWVVPQDTLEELFGTEPEAGSADDHNQLEQRARQLPMEVVVRLGEATLTISELQNLAEGDIILLDQRVGDMLPMYVSDTELYRGWAGRQGSRQAVRIEQVARR